MRLKNKYSEKELERDKGIEREIEEGRESEIGSNYRI